MEILGGESPRAAAAELTADGRALLSTPVGVCRPHARGASWPGTLCSPVGLRGGAPAAQCPPAPIPLGWYRTRPCVLPLRVSPACAHPSRPTASLPTSGCRHLPPSPATEAFHQACPLPGPPPGRRPGSPSKNADLVRIPTPPPAALLTTTLQRHPRSGHKVHAPSLGDKASPTRPQLTLLADNLSPRSSSAVRSDPRAQGQMS